MVSVVGNRPDTMVTVVMMVVAVVVIRIVDGLSLCHGVAFRAPLEDNVEVWVVVMPAVVPTVVMVVVTEEPVMVVAVVMVVMSVRICAAFHQLDGIPVNRQ